MKRFWIIIVASWWMGLSSFVMAQTQDAPAAESNAPTTAPAEPEEYELPDGPEGLVAEVGDTKILTQDLATILDKIPYRLSKKKRKEVWESNLASMIYSELLHSYLESNKAPDAPDELGVLHKQLDEEVKKYNQTASLRLLKEVTIIEMMEQRGLTQQRLVDQARYEKLLGTMTTNEELLAFMRKHPDYFNGTKVRLGHILIACSPLAPTAEQKKAIETLQKIAADVKAGKITFAQAAHEYSQCPSGQIKGPDETAEYGDLGEGTFPQITSLLGASAGTAVFGADVGAVTDVVRSARGFHLIKVYERIQGEELAGAESAAIARMGVMSLVENQIFNQALEQVPIIIYKASKKIPKPAEE